MEDQMRKLSFGERNTKGINRPGKGGYFKLFFAIMALAVIVTGCTKGGNDKPDATPTPAATSTPTPSPTATPAPTATPTPTPEPTPTPVLTARDVFDTTSDDGVYSKIGAFTGLSYSDVNYVGGRLIFTNKPGDPTEIHGFGSNTVDTGLVYAETINNGDQSGYERVYSRSNGSVSYSTGRVCSEQDPEDDDPVDDDEWDDEYGDPPVWEDDEPLQLRSVDPVEWDVIELNLEGWSFFNSAVRVMKNGNFLLYDYDRDVMMIYDNRLRLQKAIEVPNCGNFIVSASSRYIWYADEIDILRCYDIETGTGKEEDFAEGYRVMYFREEPEGDVFAAYAYDAETGDYSITNQIYLNAETGEFLGTTDSNVRYIYSSDMTKAVRVESGNRNSIQIYECLPDDLFPGETRTDPDTGEDIPAAAEAVCSLQIENANETSGIQIDWEREMIITDCYYSGPSYDSIYEHCCYSMITGEKISNYAVGDIGYKSLYYTIDPDHGLYYCQYCDDDANTRLFAWDYASDTVRTYYEYFKRFDVIPEKVENKRRELEEKYGFYFYIGTEIFVNDFSYDLKLFTDYDEVYAQMEVIDEVLSIYPEGFFEQLRYGGIKTLSIYLCGGFEKRESEGNTISDAIALASVFKYERALALDLYYASSLRSTIVHEISHWIDGRIESGAELNGYTTYDEDWLKLNPSDYDYKYSYVGGRTIWKYIFDEDGNNENTYFADAYSQTYPTEDRARHFEYLMYNDSYNPDYIALCPHMQEKLKFFFEAIRKTFDTSDWPEKTAWEEKLEEKIAAYEESQKQTEQQD